jgi:hypothetical protein
MLTPLNASEPIASDYLLAAGLDSEGKPSGNPPTGNYPASFADSYNGYATQGAVLGALNSGGDASIIESFFSSVDNSTAVITGLAQALAGFWATVAVTPGEPAHGGTAVEAVTNDALSLVGAFKSAITASITTQEKKPYFLHLVQNIQDIAVSQITWTVTEVMPDSSTADFPETIQ